MSFKTQLDHWASYSIRLGKPVMKLAWYLLQALLFSRPRAEGVLTSLSSQSWTYDREVCWWLIIAYRNQNQVENLYGRLIGIYLISYVCLIRFLLALSFVFRKTKMFKWLFILFVTKQLMRNVTFGTDIYSAKKRIIRWGKAVW